MFGFGYDINKYIPPVGPDEELHELVIDLNERPTDMNVSTFLLSEASKKANKLGKERLKVKRVEYQTEKANGFATVWFICEKDF